MNMNLKMKMKRYETELLGTWRRTSSVISSAASACTPYRNSLWNFSCFDFDHEEHEDKIVSILSLWIPRKARLVYPQGL